MSFCKIGGLCALLALSFVRAPHAYAAYEGTCTGSATGMGTIASWNSIGTNPTLQMRSCRGIYGGARAGSIGEVWNPSTVTTCVTLFASTSNERWTALLGPDEGTYRQTANQFENWTLRIFAPSATSTGNLFCKSQ
jgi:hypothetical protein